MRRVKTGFTTSVCPVSLYLHHRPETPIVTFDWRGSAFAVWLTTIALGGCASTANIEPDGNLVRHYLGYVKVVVPQAAVGTGSAMSSAAWLQVIALWAITGAIGQIIRQIASLKKILDNNPTDRMGVVLDQTRIVVNLLIGATAGVIGALSMGLGASPLETKTVLSLIGFGYAGADFIESFMRRADPVSTVPPPLVATVPGQFQAVQDAKG